METENDVWFYFAVLVASVAVFVWAFWAVTGIGGAWIPWAVGALIVLASGSVAMRAWLNARSLAWTPEFEEAQKGRAQKQLREIARGLLFVGGAVLITRLGIEEVLPQRAGAVLLLGLVVAWIFLKRPRRRSARN